MESPSWSARATDIFAEVAFTAASTGGDNEPLWHELPPSAKLAWREYVVPYITALSRSGLLPTERDVAVDGEKILYRFATTYREEKKP